jgi:hypothetical protein
MFAAQKQTQPLLTRHHLKETHIRTTQAKTNAIHKRIYGAQASADAQERYILKIRTQI